MAVFRFTSSIAAYTFTLYLHYILYWKGILSTDQTLDIVSKERTPGKAQWKQLRI